MRSLESGEFVDLALYCFPTSRLRAEQLLSYCMVGVGLKSGSLTKAVSAALGVITSLYRGSAALVSSITTDSTRIKIAMKTPMMPSYFQFAPVSPLSLVLYVCMKDRESPASVIPLFNSGHCGVESSFPTEYG